MPLIRLNGARLLRLVAVGPRGGPVFDDGRVSEGLQLKKRYGRENCLLALHLLGVCLFVGPTCAEGKKGWEKVFRLKESYAGVC